jgi:molybdopterin synthase catalytic subunit
MHTRWPLHRIALVHRIGSCPVMHTSVIICASSTHRKDSIEAVQYGIDTLKARVPIWKKVRACAMSARMTFHQKEIYEGDEGEWKQNTEFLATQSQPDRT